MIPAIGYNSYPYQIQQTNLDRLGYTDQIGRYMMANDGNLPPGGLASIHQHDKGLALDSLLSHLLGLGQQERLNSTQQASNHWANTFSYPMGLSLTG